MMNGFARLAGVGLVGSVLAVATAHADGSTPYVVSGNDHIIIGITLDEGAVRAALPEGLEPAEGITGGLNVYRSGGGEGVAAYERTYVWVDLANFDSLTGNKGRYILWLADSAHAAKMAKIGYDTTTGATSIAEDGRAVTGSTVLDGAEVMKVAIELADAACGPAVGTMNYPSLPAGKDALAATQYTFSGTACGATPVSVDISAPEGHPLATFKPQSVIWAAMVRDLSFSASPLLPIQ